VFFLLNINYRQIDFAMQQIKIMLFTNLHFSLMTQRSWMMETTAVIVDELFQCSRLISAFV